MWRRHSCPALLPVASRFFSTPVHRADTVSKRNVGMSADAAGRSACATSLCPSTCEKYRLASHLPVLAGRSIVHAFRPSRVRRARRIYLIRAHSVRAFFCALWLNATQPGLLAPTSFNVGGTQYVGAQFPNGAYVLPPGPQHRGSSECSGSPYRLPKKEISER